MKKNNLSKKELIICLLIVTGFITSCSKENINGPTNSTDKTQNKDTTIIITPNFKVDNPSIQSLDSLQKTGKNITLKPTQTDFYKGQEITAGDMDAFYNQYLEPLGQMGIEGNKQDSFPLLPNTITNLPTSVKSGLNKLCYYFYESGQNEK